MDCEALSLLARSVTWKTKSVSPQSLRRVWKTVPSIRRLSGLTSPPSTQNLGVAEWISSLGDSRVSPTVSREASSEKMTQGNSQGKSSELQPDLDTQLSFLKMSPESLDSTGTPFDPNYERWVTGLRRDSSRRQRQAHLIRESGYSSWPTPNAGPQNDSDTTWPQRREELKEKWGNNGFGLTLGMAVTNWRTPASQESGISPERLEGELGSRMYDKETGRLAQYGLPQQVQYWMTPNQRDWKGAPGAGLTERGGHQSSLPRTTTNWPTPDSNTSNYSGEGYGPNLREKATNWPTPRVSAANRPSEAELMAGNPKRRLETEATNWPTPRAIYGEHPGMQDESHLTGRAITNWPTPEARDWKGFAPKSQPRGTQDPKLYLSIPQAPTTTKDGHGSSPDGPDSHQPTAEKATTCSPKCRRLSPLFSEALMGLAPGWTDDSEPLATGLFRQWQHSLSESLR